MITAELEATAQAVVDGLEDLGAALDEMPWDVDTEPASAAMLAACQAFDHMLVLLRGDA